MIDRIVIIIGAFLLIGFGSIALPTSVEAGSAPELKPVARQYVLEGEELEVSIEAVDADGDPIELGVVSRPAGAQFTDNGDGSGYFSWMTDFNGPNSSEGSPYAVTFWAGDGENTTLMQTEIVVINMNRKPYIVSPEAVTAQSGDELNFDVAGYDPDLDPVSWEMIAAPGGLEFEGGNPGSFRWATSYGDSGVYDVQVCLSDQHGASDTAEISLTVLSTEVFALSIDTISVYPGEYATVAVTMDNLEAVSGFNIVLNYDASVLTLSSISESGTRTEAFEYFSYQINNRGIIGDILLVGVADLEGGVVGSDIGVGDGPLAEMNFYVSNNLQYAGLSVPLNFVFRDPLVNDDNSLTSHIGDKISPDQITFYDGYIIIKSASPNSLGDINLNGVAFEIGDVVYFTNYFINPKLYPMTPEQWLNSDVNMDGYGGTVADLVYMLNVIINAGIEGNKIVPVDDIVKVGIERSDDEFQLIYNSPIEMGGLALTLQGDNRLDIETEINSMFELSGMAVKSSVDGDIIRVLIYSEEGTYMPSGVHQVVKIMNSSNLTIKDIQLSSADGLVLRPQIEKSAGTLVPGSFMLHQNYPNPFNPTTEIKFDLPQSASVNLTVYNLLGREIRSLVDETLPAGVHVVVWDGRDDTGQAVASGIYFYRLSSDAYSARKKMLLLK